ncbi:DNA polymerase III subunit chi [Neisseria zalophi]|uniref:DNA polymerase III subunit chi n=1 Tax=Neisseria zalophi TaxID=640030 RepID=A0A5J6PTQ9_9NEIS|nr:DNA polymerase III subunit chi [Neisseria zalophi]QEY25746.1 DNA polymerase III subunit chi [Neisseria zalophi]
MPQATFYTHVADPAAFVCRLAARATQGRTPVLLWVESAEAVSQFDTALWQFEAESFLAHEIWLSNESFPQHVPLVLAGGNEVPTVPEQTVVLNYSPDFWCDAAVLPTRVLEIVGNDLEELAEARERFKAYRQKGFQIEHHNMQGKA